MEPISHQFNVVVVPTSDPAAGNQTFLLSAMRRDRAFRMVSPDWTESQVRQAFALAGAPPVEVENLLRGNRMTRGGRDTRYLHFSEDQLRNMGLAPEVRPVETGDILTL